MVKSAESNLLTLLDLYMVDSVSDGITSKPEYALYILEALRTCGGKASEMVENTVMASLRPRLLSDRKERKSASRVHNAVWSTFE